MASAIFDTHAFIKRLTAAGMPERQAEVLAEEHARMPGEQLATKHDIALLRADMERLKDQLTVRLGGHDGGRDCDRCGLGQAALRGSSARQHLAMFSEPGKSMHLVGEQVATKQDVALLRADLELLRADITAMEERIKDQLTIRLGGILAAAVAIIAALVKLF